MSERAELHANLSAKQGELNVCVNAAASLEARIQDIKALIEEFKVLKADLKTLRKNLDKDARATHTYWVGNRLDTYQDILGKDLSDSALKSYIGNVDDNLDELNNALMRMENELYDMEGLIGNIKSAINWISTKIENLLN